MNAAAAAAILVNGDLFMLRKYATKNDILLALALLVFGIAVFAFLRLSAGHPGGLEVVVRVSGEEVFRSSLYEDITEDIDSPRGHNTLEISNGQACITDSDCEGRVCIKTGKIRKAGDCILCLPHGLIVVIEGRDTAIPDAVSY